MHVLDICCLRSMAIHRLTLDCCNAILSILTYLSCLMSWEGVLGRTRIREALAAEPIRLPSSMSHPEAGLISTTACEGVTHPYVVYIVRQQNTQRLVYNSVY